MSVAATNLGRVNSPGFFITLEGGDGAGKTTQADLLAPWLREATNREVVLTHEPGGTEMGAALRQLVQDGDDMNARTEALLYAADRAHHVDTIVAPALQRGAIVISDRYFDSSIAYQAGGRELPHEIIEKLSMWATDGIIPDCTILLNVEPDTTAKRMMRNPDRLERAGLAFHQRTRDAYLRLANADPDRWVIVDADGSVDDVQDQIRAAVMTHPEWVKAHPRGFSHQFGAGVFAEPAETEPEETHELRLAHPGQ